MKIRDYIVSGALGSSYAKKNPQVLEWMNQDLEKMLEYYRHVYSMTQRIQLARVRMDTEDYQSFVMELDQQRKYKHDAAISAVRDLDSCCIQTGFGSCLDSDIEKVDRSIIADAIFAFCDKWVRKSAKSN